MINRDLQLALVSMFKTKEDYSNLFIRRSQIQMLWPVSEPI